MLGFARSTLSGYPLEHKLSVARWNRDSHKGKLLFACGSAEGSQNQISLFECEDLPPQLRGSGQTFDHSPQRVICAPHEGEVTDLAFLDGDRFITSSSTGEVGVWRFSSELTQLECTGTVQCSSFASNDITLQQASCSSLAVNNSLSIAAGGEDGKIAFLNVETGKQRYIDFDNVSAISDLCWTSPSTIAAGDYNGNIALYDQRTLSQTQLFPNVRLYQSSCIGIENDPSRAHRIATIYEDSTLWFWDLRNTNAPTNEVKFADYSARSIVFHPNDNQLLIGCSDGAMRVLNMDGFNYADLKGAIDAFPQSESSYLSVDSVDIHTESEIVLGAGRAGEILLGRIQ